MQVRETQTRIEATALEQAVVAELSAPVESPFGRPPLTITMYTPDGVPLYVLGPAEPVDEPGDE